MPTGKQAATTAAVARSATRGFVLFGIAGLAAVCALMIVAATLTMRRSVERDAMIRVEQGMQVAWHLLRERGTDYRLRDGALYASDHRLEGDLPLVDEIQRLVGGVATLFRGDERIATTVLDEAGNRRLGSHLVSAAAREAVLAQHRSFRGTVEALGKNYYSAYDPIDDRDGHLIGILSVGLEQSEVQAAITRMALIISAACGAAALLAGFVFDRFGRRLGRQIAAREASLAMAGERLDTALASMANGLCLFDADNRLVLINNRLCEMLGTPRDKIVPGMHFREYLGLRHAAGNFGGLAFEDIYAERLARIGERRALSHIDQTISGRVITIHHRPIASGGWVATYDDITDQRNAERAVASAEAALLRERERLAEEASRAKSGFLAMMSHEIRTPMNAVLGLAGSLLDSPMTAEQHRMVENIHESGDLLLRILNDILDFTKLEAGRMTFEAAPFSPTVLTHSVISVLGPQARAKGLAITVECDASLPEALTADAGRVRQILLNLASNAVKFTERGAVTIRADCLSRSDGSARIEWLVSDTGIGIAPDRIGTLFGDFVQADLSITRRFGGSGLGLAICKRLADQMGGEIGVRSTPGQGTVFRVSLQLPISAAVPISATRPADVTPAFRAMLQARSERLRILFAEDNATNQMVVRQLLKGLDVQVDMVGDGREAVAAAVRFAYDVIFMDMRMPEMDGLRAARLIRQQGGRLARVPIVALTANAFAEDVKACLDAGMNQFLPKPVSKDMLLGAMHQVLTAADPQSVASPPAETQVYDDCDHAGLARLRIDIGGEAVAEMLELFRSDARKRLELMASRLCDHDALLREAHSLRGAAAAACATSLAQRVGEIEARAKAGMEVTAEDVARAQAALQGYLAETAAIIVPAG